MNTNCTIAQKEGTGHAMPVLSISFIKANCQTIGQLKARIEEIKSFSTGLAKAENRLNIQKGYSECVEHLTPSLMPSQSNSIAIKLGADINGRH